MQFVPSMIGRLFAREHRDWEARMLARIPAADVDDRLRESRNLLDRVLRENLLPFWIEHPPRDARHGGILLAEVCDGGRSLNLILLSRYLWFVSKLAEGEYGKDVHLELAKESYGLLRELLYDPEHGGFFWERDLDSDAPSKPNKHLYGQSFAIYALTQYGKAAADRRAVDLAEETFALLEAHAHDTEFGGYSEYFARDWSATTECSYVGWDGHLKLVNTHIHLLEAFTALFRVAPGIVLRDRIAELIDVLSERTIVHRFGVSLDRHRRDWAPLRGRSSPFVSYGHDLESIYLLVEACATIGADYEGLVGRFRTRFAYCMTFGFDFEGGGFFDRGLLGRHADNMNKVWWVQAEAMLAALTMYRLTLERHYLAVFEATLEWITTAQVDWDGGEWHRQIDPRGHASGAKVDRWKGPYHNGRAVLECIALIDELCPRPGIILLQDEVCSDSK